MLRNIGFPWRNKIRMKIIIPMSGKGQRFIKGGYIDPKPLIKVEGKPIIHHVMDMYQDEVDFVFICNETHLKETNMREVLESYCKTGKIISIKEHKYGPVYAVSKVFDLINDNEAVIVSYCDFSCYWDYSFFKNWVKNNKFDACLPAYKGFHPHSLQGNNYAFIKEKDYLFEEIKEKEAYTNDKLNEFASSGTYYFSKGLFLKESFDFLIKNNINVNGEFYCSLAFNYLARKGLKIGIYELQHFMQWGTPEDLEEYNYWSNIFNNLVDTKLFSACKSDGINIIPMAGKGSRFKKEGYLTPKPYIEVSKKEMCIQSCLLLPKNKENIFLTLKKDSSQYKLKSKLAKNFKKFDIFELDNVPKGQLATCREGLVNLKTNKEIIISACDHGVIYNQKKLNSLKKEFDPDLIVWVTKNYPGAIRNPEMYGWINFDGNQILDISVKKKLLNPHTDPMIIGTFTFKNISIFNAASKSLIDRNETVNNEFYLDSCIKDALNLGFNCRLFFVENYICWGTPNDLKTFEYWQSCFHKWPIHKYDWQKDILNSNNFSLPSNIYNAAMPEITC